MDNLPELRDIHLPSEGISIFPLAYGWWVILAFIILLYICIKGFLWVRRNSRRVYASYLLKKTAQADTLQSAVNMSELLRRICVSRYPEAVALSGNDWISFLNDKAKDKLGEKTASLLKDAPYLPKDNSEYSALDVKALRRFCQLWIGDNL